MEANCFYCICCSDIRVQEAPPAFVPAPFISATPAPRTQTIPDHISIPSVHVDVAVRPGSYDFTTGQWDLSWNTAQFATMTVTPNTVSGKTLLYAHNTKKLFGPIARMKLGDEATVTTSDGTVFHYVYAQEQVVGPADTSILTNAEDGIPQLVLLTCSGVFNQHRNLLFFTLRSVEHVNS